MICTLAEWQKKEKDVGDFIVQASVVDGSDSWQPFPIGMQYSYCNIYMEGSKLQIGEHELVVFCGISETTDSRRRGGGLNRRGFLDKLKKNGIINTPGDSNTYFCNLPKYKFVISPEGNGIDCHRHYEALMAGCIPIVEDNPLIRNKYRGCPILYTSDYSEINESYLLQKYEEMIHTSYDFSRLFLSYYDDATQTCIRECGNFWTNIFCQKNWYKNNEIGYTMGDLLFISVFNYGCIGIAHNHLESLKRNRIQNYQAFVTDNESLEYLSSRGYHVVLIDESQYTKEKTDFDTKPFNELTYLRYKIIQKLLQENKTVWYLDVDTVVLKDLNADYMDNYIHMDFDIMFQNDINMFCSGCMLFRPNKKNEVFCQHIYDNRTDKYNDQIILLNVINSNVGSYNIKTFDVLKYPNGLLFFNELHEHANWRNAQEYYRSSSDNTYFVHANWMVGVDTKINALKSKQLWFIG
jgi:hypothetical protein